MLYRCRGGYCLRRRPDVTLETSTSPSLIFKGKRGCLGVSLVPRLLCTTAFDRLTG